MDTNKKQERVIETEKFIAGLLCQFNMVDGIDLNILIKDFESKTKTRLKGSFKYFENIGDYVKVDEDGTVHLKYTVSLKDMVDDIIGDDEKTLFEKLHVFAGDEVNKYFDDLDREKLKSEKNNLLEKNKENVLNNGKVLIISDDEEDYNEFIKYGFKNVDYFRSIVRADRYFKKYPDRLKQYHIILKGRQKVQRCCFEGAVDLDRTLRDINPIDTINISLQKYGYPEYNDFEGYVSARHGGWQVIASTYSSFINKIVENCFVNDVLNKTPSNNYPKYVDYVNPYRLPLVRNKEDLKILYLGWVNPKLEEEIKNDLGLNITFKEDDNCSLGRYVKEHLGDYDIIIASKTYSERLLNMNKESTEQCKDTGRELTILAVYEDSYCGVYDALGPGIKMTYSCGGNLAPDDYDEITCEVKMLHPKKVLDSESDYYRPEAYTSRKVILESAVNFYNDALVKNNKAPMNLDFKTIEETNKEYEKAFEEQRKRREEEQSYIASIDYICSEAGKYLRNRSFGKIIESPEGLNITKLNDGIKIENIFQGRTLCTLTCLDSYIDDERVVKIQTISQKGTLTSPQTVIFNSSRYHLNDEGEFKPDEKQKSVVSSIEKKVEHVLEPLNNSVYNDSSFGSRKPKRKKRKNLALRNKKFN